MAQQSGQCGLLAAWTPSKCQQCWAEGHGQSGPNHGPGELQDGDIWISVRPLLCHLRYGIGQPGRAAGQDGGWSSCSGGSAPCYPSYIIAPQQAADREDTISDSNESIRVCVQLFLGWRLGFATGQVRSFRSLEALDYGSRQNR